MNTEQLTSILRERSPDLDFVVTSANRLPLQTNFKRPAGLIVNTDPSHKPGKHWVCFFFPESGPAEFFDSLGHAPEHYYQNFRNLLIATGPEYQYSTKQLQDAESPHCGAYCLYYLVHRKNGTDYRNILARFGENLKLNDARVVEWLESV